MEQCSTDPVQEALLDERRKLEVAIQQELKGKGPAMGGAALGASSAEASASGAAAQEGGVDALDAFMSNMQHQIEEDKVRLGLTSTVPLLTLHQHHNAKHIGSLAIQSHHMPFVCGTTLVCSAVYGGGDALQVTALQKEVEEIDKQVAEAERMLKFADPGVLPATPTVMCRQ